MSYPTFANPRARRTILASVAVAALAAGGAFAEGALTSSHSAHAAAVMTSDLNAQGTPSFATLIERVKPAVVSVKVKIANASSEDNGVQMDNLPPEIQQFLKRFGGAGGMNGGMQQKLAADDRRGLGLLRFRRRLHRHQQSRGPERQDRHRDHG